MKVVRPAVVVLSVVSLAACTSPDKSPRAERAPADTEPTLRQIDLDGDGQPDAFDTDGDGVADAIDSDGDGLPDAYDTDGDGALDDWDGDGEPDAVPPGVYDGDLANEDSDADGYCFAVESGWYECDDGAPPGSGVPGTPELGDPGLGGDAPAPPAADDGGDDDDVFTPGTGGNDQVCDEVLFPASETIPPRILLVVDKSGSMDEEAVGYPGSKWEGAVASLSAVVTSLSGDVDFGLMLYPDGDASSRVCRAGAVEVNVSANNAQAIVAELEATTPGGGTPTAKTLGKALEQLSALPAAGGSRVVVLATDGGPNCNTDLNPATCRCVQPGQCTDARNCLDDAEATAQAASLNAAGFSVFVIGIPGSENFTDVLNGLADAGGTARPGATRYYQANNASGLASALENIASRVATCRFDLARAVPADADITVTAGGTTVPADPSRTNGWALVDNDTIELFGAACDSLVNAPANVQIDACFDPSGGG